MNEFAEQLIDAERFAAMPHKERNDLCWRAGTIRHLFDDLQQGWYDKYRAWEAIDLYATDLEFKAGSYPRVFGMKCGKRTGKTTFSVGVRIEDGIRFPDTKYRHTTALQKSVGEILSDVLPMLLDRPGHECPRDVYPVYQGKKGPKPAGLYWPEWGPACGSVLYLAGIDENPDALRGQACHGDNITEAAFIKKLRYAVKNVLYHQYQGRRRARMIMESSAPEDLETDWEIEFLPDFEERDAYVEATIEDNNRLPRAEKDEFIAAAGGRGDPECEREYFNKIQGNPVLVVVPEFQALEATVVTPHVRPRYAYTLTAADPGMTHQFGLVFGYVDFDTQKGVVQDSWAKSNAPTRQVAAVVAAREYDLWGTWPSNDMGDIPLYGDGKKLGWVDMLMGDRCADLAEDLFNMAQKPASERPDFSPHPDYFKTHIPIGHLCYWDGARFKPNPYLRVSDVEKRMIADISTEFGLEFQATSKEELRKVMVAKVRNMLGDGQLEFEPDAGPVLKHTRAAKWDKSGKKFEEHKKHGHYDCLAALVYWVRAVDLVLNRRPHPPVIQVPMEGTLVVNNLPWQKPAVSEQVQALNQLLGYSAQGSRSKRPKYGFL
jgi:hypothetical protein